MVDKKEIHEYSADWDVYAMAWSNREDKPYRMAIGSFKEDYSNQVEIVQLDEKTTTFNSLGKFDHLYPPTKLLWHPDKTGTDNDILCSSGDYLRLWNCADKPTSICTLKNNKSSEFCAPITSFDWNESDQNTICSCSIDTTCTIWDIENQKPKTQLIAHDQEVYDVCFKRGLNIFASVGADGSLRVFDLRNLEHSTIIYESPNLVPLLRVLWNKQDPNYLATFLIDSSKILLLDIRLPSLPVVELSGHKGPINAIAWAPQSSCHLASAGEDFHALIWDLTPIPDEVKMPALMFNAGNEINSMQWPSQHSDWISIATRSRVQMLRV